jgi:hypothetical protein
MKRKPQLKPGMLTAAIVLSCGVLPVMAEEESEHLMTAVSGTQISGYVSTTASWMAGRPLLTERPTLWSLHEALNQPARSPQSAFDPLSSAQIQKLVDPVNDLRSADGFVVAVGPQSGDPGGMFTLPQAPDSSASFGLSAVPEPGTAALLGLGVLGACWRRLRGQATR